MARVLSWFRRRKPDELLLTLAPVTEVGWRLLAAHMNQARIAKADARVVVGGVG